MINLSSPNLGKEEEIAVRSCIKSTWLSSSGKYVHKFENKLKRILKSNYVVSCQSGSAALFLSFKILKIQPETEIFAPSITFVSSINAIVQNNCYPIFLDVDAKNRIDFDKFVSFVEKYTLYKKGCLYNKKTYRKIRAIVIPHLFGQCALTKKIKNFCKKRNILIIEDSAESLGSYLLSNNKKNHLGTIGDIGCLSFNVNKIITTGGGGALILKTKKEADYARYLINQSKNNAEFYIHDEVGYNLSMSNLNAAIGYEQLKKFKKFFKIKKKIFNTYKSSFENLKDHFVHIEPDKNVISNYWLNILHVKKGDVKKLYNYLKLNKIEARLLWLPNHLQKSFKKYQAGLLTQTKKNYKKQLCIPSGTTLKQKEQKKIINTIKKFYDK